MPDAPPDMRAGIAALFSRSAETYDEVGVDFFSVFGRQLVEDADVRSGERVLDIGTGRGAVLFPAAEAVGPAGSVLGVDLAEGMIERTQQVADSRGLTNVSLEVMDAQELDLPAGSFDVVLSSLVVFFLPDPASAVERWARLLARGGRLGLTTFAGDDDRFAWIDRLFKPFMPPHLSRPQRPDPGSPFASTENLERMLRAAGLSEVTSVIREHDVVFDDPRHWIRWSWSHGQRIVWENVPEDQRERVEQDAIEHLSVIQEQDGTVILHQPVRYTIARVS